MKLEEGRNYIFKVLKKIGFEDNDYFVLKGPDQRSYLIPSLRYSGYNISPGITINCLVDKINCNGEVYLEPEHPNYRKGEMYEFTIKGEDKRIDRSGNTLRVILASGVDDTEVVISETYMGNGKARKGTKIRMQVERITKGQIIVSGAFEDQEDMVAEGDTLFQFHIDRIEKGIDGRDYFHINGPSESQHSVPVDYYKHYGLREGSFFKGRFRRYKKGSDIRIEPENPFFQIGEVYEFKVKQIIPVSNGSKQILIISDKYGHSHRVMESAKVKPGTTLKMKVEKIRKGWPQLKRM